MTQEEAYGELARAIVFAAIEDWKRLCDQLMHPKERAQVNWNGRTNFKMLREFFRSEWAYALCVGIEPLVILDGLEKELVETERKIKLMEVANG